MRLRRDPSLSYLQHINEFRRRGISQIAGIAVGDENLPGSCGGLRDVNACPAACSRAEVLQRRKVYTMLPVVVRNYVNHTDCDALPHVLTVPLGTRVRPAPGTAEYVQARVRRWRDPASRNMAWCFSSTRPNTIRSAIVRALIANRELQALPHHLHYPHFGGRRAKDGDDPLYTPSLENASFAICPPGNSVDTFRHMEAMDCGAIPVTTSAALAYYRRLLPETVTRHWVDFGDGVSPNSTAAAVALMRQLLANSETLRQRQRAMLRAYERHEETWTGMVARRLAALRPGNATMSRSYAVPKGRPFYTMRYETISITRQS